MKTTLVIMAAGIGSRFGGGIKQLAPVGLNGEIIMDYSIHDAIEAGFNKIVFIIRKDIKDAFKEVIGDRIEKICKDLDVEIAYAAFLICEMFTYYASQGIGLFEKLNELYAEYGYCLNTLHLGG